MNLTQKWASKDRIKQWNMTAMTSASIQPHLPPDSYPDPFDTSTQMWGPKRIEVTSTGSNTDTEYQRRRYKEAADTAYFHIRGNMGVPFPTASASANARSPYAPASAPTNLPSTSASAMASDCVCNIPRDRHQRLFVLRRRITCKSLRHHAHNCTCHRCRDGH